MPNAKRASPETANLDPDDVRRRLRAGTKAIIAPHMLGRPAPVRELRALGVPVVEDCAMALGGKVGLQGDASVFSFYATKMMATGHGGAVVARDRAVVRRIADLVDYDNREDYRVRYNYRMSALVAAVVSQVLIVLWWPDARAGTLANVLILAAVVWRPGLAAWLSAPKAGIRA